MMIRQIRIQGLIVGHRRHQTDMVRGMEALQMRPVIDRRFPLREIVEALRWVNDGHAKGKVVITEDEGR